MSCLSVSTSGGSILYDFSLFEVDFSSLWTLMPDAPDINFPLITFSNTIDGSVPVYGAQTGGTLESIYYPSFPNSMQLIEPDFEDYNAKVLAKTPSTISYLISGIIDVFSSTASISREITYGPSMVVSASQDPAVELERAWDEAWERGLINPTASILYSYFNLMGLKYEMDIRKSEGTNIIAFTNWLNTELIPDDIQSNLLALDAQMTSDGEGPWDTEYNYTNSGFEPYRITSVFYGIQNLKENPEWSCTNPYTFPDGPWTKYKDFDRPRLDSTRAYGRLIIPDKITKVRSDTYTVTAASISGSNVLTMNVPYGFDVTDFVKSPYGSAFSPTISAGNWEIETLITSNLWEFDNTHFGAVEAADDHFTVQIRVPLSLKNKLKADPSFGSEVISINWTGKFIAATEDIYPMMSVGFFDQLYQSCDSDNTEKVRYVKGIGILFDVQSFSNGANTLQSSLVSCKSDILEIYDNYYEYAGNYSVKAQYGDIINTHGRYLDTHGCEFFATAKQVLRPQEYIVGDNVDVEIINLNAIVNADEAKACADGQLYNADDLTDPCPLPGTVNIFQTNQVPNQKSSTSVSLSGKLNKINGKICPVLPPNFTVKK